MSFSFCSFSSGSSGNCYFIRTERTAILLDAGISCKRIMEGLSAVATAPAEVSALLITHEHSDHVKGVATLAKKLPALEVFASYGTWTAIDERVPRERQRLVESGSLFAIGDIDVLPFSVSHDAAEPMGYSFFHEGKKLSVLTDTGYIPEEVFAHIEDSDFLVLEANYEPEMLLMGRYPYFLKHRIQGEKGHLSNLDAADAICRLAGAPISASRPGSAHCGNCGSLAEAEAAAQGRRLTVLLAHLSKENNMPELAYQTVKNCLEEKDLFLGEDLKLEVLLRDRIGDLYQL